MIFNISAKQVKSLREEKQLSLFEAKEILIKQQLLTYIDSATTIEELKDVLRYLVNKK